MSRGKMRCTCSVAPVSFDVRAEKWKSCAGKRRMTNRKCCPCKNSNPIRNRRPLSGPGPGSGMNVSSSGLRVFGAASLMINGTRCRQRRGCYTDTHRRTIRTRFLHRNRRGVCRLRRQAMICRWAAEWRPRRIGAVCRSKACWKEAGDIR